MVVTGPWWFPYRPRTSLEGFVVVGLVGTVLGCFVSYVENYTVDASIFVA